MTEAEELNHISKSILLFLVAEPDLFCKSTAEIYNLWAAKTGNSICYPNNIKWAIRFLKEKKDDPIIKSKALAQILSAKEKENGNVSKGVL